MCTCFITASSSRGSSTPLAFNPSFSPLLRKIKRNVCRKESDDTSESETESSSDVATKSNSAANVQLGGERILADLVDARNLIDDLQKVYEKQEVKLQQLEYYTDV